MTYRAVLFDLDGTLIDTATDMLLTLSQLADEHQQPHNINIADYRGFITHGSAALIESIFGRPPQAQRDRLQKRYLELYQQNLNQNTHLFEGVGELLSHLNQANIPWGIVTNKPAWLAKPIVAHLPELAAGRVLICADEVGHSKPHPEPIKQALKDMQVNASETLYLGDAESDILAAHAAGTQSAIALWGYLHDHDRPEHWQAHHNFTSPLELIELLA
ncbi:MAG: HAD family hydrolase [Proteobacteria bacterium]|nr:MAG: HAD family hydrolase [Pseudomonadota bacterium]